jgi:hypothetical protein
MSIVVTSLVIVTGGIVGDDRVFRAFGIFRAFGLGIRRVFFELYIIREMLCTLCSLNSLESP